MKFQRNSGLEHATAQASEAAATPSMKELLAIMIPLATMINSIAWAIAVYLIVREKERARVEIARLDTEGSGPLLRSTTVAHFPEEEALRERYRQ
ncbi:hypothetical protein [Dictyobacter formicarum]|uniref:Uncharacterized protein n=1 Tax=Dictyobacter formicarum TaxID=2778368 RepID=A0ABQ3VU69_9CHLR|nr:hypothetical protein [Dictyobacter formicarum]GHO89286.1 hypothetical protein KSZ_72920 [Dictyobacter formicarum]